MLFRSARHRLDATDPDALGQLPALAGSGSLFGGGTLVIVEELSRLRGRTLAALLEQSVAALASGNAIALVDACVRLLPGVMGEAHSADEESFADGLLEYPHYTRPAVWAGRPVPEVLVSGHHEKIRAWRRAEAERLGIDWKQGQRGVSQTAAGVVTAYGVSLNSVRTWICAPFACAWSFHFGCVSAIVCSTSLRRSTETKTSCCSFSR